MEVNLLHIKSLSVRRRLFKDTFLFLMWMTLIKCSFSVSQRYLTVGEEIGNS